MSSPRIPASHSRAKLTGERQHVNAEAKRLAHALRDLTPTYPPPCGTKAIRPLTSAFFNALKHGLALGHAEVLERQKRRQDEGA